MGHMMQHINAKAQNLFKQEEGITFVELILVCAFSVFVIILMYQLIFMAQNGATANEKNARMTGDAGVVLDIMDRYLSQNTELLTMGPYEFTVTMPKKDDNPSYPVTFSARDDGRLVMARTMNGTTEELVLSKNNANQAANTGLFSSFIDASGSEMSLESGIDFAQVRAVKVTIIAKNPNPKDSNDAYVSSSRIVYFRNR